MLLRPLPIASRIPLLAALTLALQLIGMPAMATEEPPYDVLEKLGEVEIRSYAAVVLAETEVEGTFEGVSSAAFRRLAGYIFGGNRVRGAAGEKTKIEMTAPVGMRPAGSAKIAMTAPVGMRPAADGAAAPAAGSLRALGDVVRDAERLDPGDAARADRPPRDAARSAAAPDRRAAVLRPVERRPLRGSRSACCARQLATSGWQVTGPAESLRYDPPWTLWFLRRNEVALPVVRAGR